MRTTHQLRPRTAGGVHRRAGRRPRPVRLTAGRALAAGATAAVLTATPGIWTAASATPSNDRPTVTVVASGTSTMFGPDDVTRVNDRLYVAWQNGIGPAGQPSASGATASTVVEYGPTGAALEHWSVPGHVDGLAAGLSHGRLLATANEDGNSSLYTIDPGAPSGAQLQRYRYNLSPLPHGGGTDAVSVYNGQILISASAPTSPSGPALYEATLAGSAALLRPVFFDNSGATVANVGSSLGRPVSLALTDPDSNEVVPPGATRFGGDFLVDSQGDQQQVYVTGADGPRPHLAVLNLSQAVDDTAFPTDSTGTLYVTDGADNEVFAVTGGFVPGTALVAVTPSDANVPVDAPNYLGRLDLRTGVVTPWITTIQAKGLHFER